MTTQDTELRANADITLPCPACGADCQPDYVTKLNQRKEQIPTGTVVLPKHALELQCSECGLELWLTLDAQGKPIPY